MISEAEFQAALDAQPDDHTTRLVFADWLDERGDPRAEGYRALGRLSRLPDPEEITPVNWNFASEDGGAGGGDSILPWDWFKALAPGNRYWSFDYDTRRQAEDAAALAFAKLPAERRAELLAPVKAVPA